MWVLKTMLPESGLRIAPNCPGIEKMTMRSQFSQMTSSSIVFYFFLFSLSSLVTGPSFISVSSLVLELWQFNFIRDWPEICKLETLSPEFCPISEDWGELGKPNLALIKCYEILQNTKITVFTISRLFRENQKMEGGGGRGGGGKITPPHPPNQIMVEIYVVPVS